MILAIDIGGTKTLIALYSQKGRVLKKKKFKTAHGYKSFIRDLVSNLDGFRKRRIDSVTVAIPGVVQKNYTVKFGNRDWPDFDLITPLKELFSCPIYFENDANLAALYESYRLPGKTVFHFFGGCRGKSQGKNPVNRNPVLNAPFHDAGHEDHRFSGAGAGADHDVPAAVFIDDLKLIRIKMGKIDFHDFFFLSSLRRSVNTFSLAYGSPWKRQISLQPHHLQAPSAGIASIRGIPSSVSPVS